MNKITFGELLADLEDEAIAKRVIELYPDQDIEGYREVLKKLRTLKPTSSDCKLAVQKVFDDDSKEWYVGVSGLKGRTYYAIEYSPWSEWLAMPVMAKTLKAFKPLDIAAYALWEMTWSGFEEKEIQKKLDILVDAANDLRRKVAKVMNKLPSFKAWDKRNKREITKLIARFIGTDGSMGYRHGQIYTLHISQREYSFLHPFTRKSVDVKVTIIGPPPLSMCPYTSWKTFRQNWEIIDPKGGEVERHELDYDELEDGTIYCTRCSYIPNTFEWKQVHSM